jgi:hypothetical protein
MTAPAVPLSGVPPYLLPVDPLAAAGRRVFFYLPNNKRADEILKGGVNTMTVNEAYSLAIAAVERRLGETAEKWGYTIKKVIEGDWVCWRVAELDPYEFISVSKFTPYVRLWRPTNQVRRFYPEHCSPEELQNEVTSFVSRALEKVIVTAAWGELRAGCVGMDIWRGKGLTLRIGKSVYISINYHLGKKFWNWKIKEGEKTTIALIRRPIGENPVKTLLEAAKLFGLLAL